MQLIDCSACGRRISAEAESCPQCGHPRAGREQKESGGSAGAVADLEVAGLKVQLRRQRIVLGCLIAVILGLAGILYIGYQLLAFLRELGRGHPG